MGWEWGGGGVGVGWEWGGSGVGVGWEWGRVWLGRGGVGCGAVLASSEASRIF